MRRLSTLLMGLAAALLLFAVAEAGDEKKGKEKTIKGLVTCAKCNFKAVKKVDADAVKPTECQTVLIAKGKKGEKSIIYFFDADSHKMFHKPICTSPTPGAVTGTVTKEGDKLIISATEVKLKKKKKTDD